MPYAIQQNPGTHTYRVVNMETGFIHAERTTKAKAEAQVRLLHGIEHGGLIRRKK